MTLRLHAEDPSDGIEQLYQRILHERMQGLPVLNAALRVEAIDFQSWQGQWLGALITPWAMVLVLVPQMVNAWVPVRDNQRRFVDFPAGQFAFLGNLEAEFGEYQTCSLFAQMSQFSAQHVAAATARASLLAILTAPSPAAKTPNTGAAGTVRRSLTAEAATDTDAPQTSRRRFLFMR